MPYPNEHACRLIEPGKFQEGSFRRVRAKRNGKRVAHIFGKLKGEDTMTLQAVRYPKAIWTAREARSDCKKHSGILFEPAGEAKEADMTTTSNTDGGNYASLTFSRMPATTATGSVTVTRSEVAWDGGDPTGNGPAKLTRVSSPEAPDGIERRYISLADAELRLDGGEGEEVIEGHAAVFNQITDLGWFKEKILPGAFAKSLKRGDEVVALFNHDANWPLGRRSAKTLEVSEDKRGLFSRIHPPDTGAGRDVVTNIQRGDVKGMSFAFRTMEDRWHTEDGKDVRELVEVDLIDVSPVVFPAYAQTDVGVAKRSWESYRRSEEDRRANSPELLRRKLDLADATLE